MSLSMAGLPSGPQGLGRPPAFLNVSEKRFQNGHDSDLAARIRTFETEYQMQFEAPEAFDLSKENDKTLELYGLKRGDTRATAGSA